MALAAVALVAPQLRVTPWKGGDGYTRVEWV